MSVTKKIDLITPLFAITLFFTFIAAVAIKPGMTFYWIVIFIVVAALGISAINNLIMFKMGVRNIYRRKGHSAILISGLMIGTIIIASSLIVGDTMDEMVTSLNYDIFHEVDEVVEARDIDGSRVFYNQSVYHELREKILSIENVEDVTGEIQEAVSVINIDEGQIEPTFTLIGYNISSGSFGEFKSDGKTLPFEISGSELYMDKNSADSLLAKKGNTIMITTATGQHMFTVKDIVDDDGRTDWVMGGGLFMPLSSAQRILNETGINTAKVTNKGGVVGGEKYCDEIQEGIEKILESGDYGNLQITRNKKTEVEESREGISSFTDMFLIFGSFSIIAGVILIINIFVMLAEERKSEMGMARAVGMKRIHLGRSYLYEGSVYAFISAFIGAVSGIIVAYIVLYFTDSIISSVGGGINFSIIENFNYQPISIIQAFTFGMLITLITVSFASKRVSKLNIVRAIRNIPEPKIPKKSTRMLIIGGILTALGLAFIILSIAKLQSYQLAAFYLGASLAIFGSGFLMRRYMDDRWAFTIACSILLIVWIIPDRFTKVSTLVDDIGDIEMFILSGMFMVSSAVLIFIYNSKHILDLILKLWSYTKRPTATLKAATSYPMRNKFRTGMTIFMFALIIFTIVVMYMIVGIMSYNIDRITQEQLGGLDIVGTTNPNNPIMDMSGSIEMNDNLTRTDFNSIYNIYAGYVDIDTSNLKPSQGTTSGDVDFIPVSVFGFGSNFAKENKWTFTKYLDDYGSEREVWEAVYNNNSLVILDNTFITVEDMGPPTPYSGLGYDIGKTIQLKSPTGEVMNKTIVGVLDQFIFNGLFVSDNAVKEEMGVPIPTIYLFDLKDPDSADSIAKDLEREFSINTIPLRSTVEQFTNIMEQFFNLFTGFMALGLVVGIAGLGIITLRAVHERRLEIGMLRAIGFKRRNVTMVFIQEATFICIVGIFLGVVLGIIVGYNIWYDGFKEMDYEFYIPWVKILTVSVIAFVSTAIFTIPPSYMASRVAPAEALRYD